MPPRFRSRAARRSTRRISASPNCATPSRAYVSRLHRPTSAEHIAVTASGMSALMLTVEALVAPGDRVVVVTPLWPNLVEIPKILSANVVCVPLEFRTAGWTLDVDRLLASLTPDTRVADDQFAQQSDRVDHRPREPAGDPRALPPPGNLDRRRRRVRAAGLRRHGMRAVVPGPGLARRPRDQHQQLLEVVADDGLAVGLDRRAGGADAGLGQADRIQHVVFAGLRPARGRCRDHGRRTDDRPHARTLPRGARLSRAGAGAAAANRSRAAGGRHVRVLSRRRRHRQPGVLQAARPRGAAGLGARQRVRSGRRRLRPLVLRVEPRAPRRRRRPARRSSCASDQETRVPTFRGRSRR